MILRIIGKNDSNYDCWDVKDEQNNSHIVDLVVDNSDVRPILQPGARVEVDYLQPYVEIGVNVRLAG